MTTVPHGRSLPRVLVLSLFALSILVLSGVQAFDAASSGSTFRLLLAVLPAWLAAVALYVVGCGSRARPARYEEDALTGLATREHALRVIDAELDARDGQAPAVVVFELDRFDVFRDANGAAVANGVLRAFGRILRQHTRRANLSARAGEHRFIAVLRAAVLEDAWAFAEHVQADFRRAGATAALPTLSIGIACGPAAGRNAEAVIARASSALDMARIEGGDRIVAEGRRPEDSGPGEPALQPEPPQPPLGDGERILIVEDERALRAIANRVLEDAGYRVETAANARDALEMFDAGADSIDLVVTDVVLPDFGGRELADRVAVVSPDTRVLLVSGATDDLTVIHSMRAGVVPFVAKPFTPEQLLSAVRRALDV